MNQLLMNEIKELYSSLSKINTYYEKDYILTVFNYLHESLPKNEEISKMCNGVRKALSNRGYRYLIYLLFKQDLTDKYMKKNNNFFEKYIPKVIKNEDQEHYLISLSEDNISFILNSFFNSLNDEISCFYRKILDEGRLFYGNDNNTVITSLDKSESIIFIKKLENFKDILILIHEIGHAYYFYLNKQTIAERSKLGVEIKEEIPAKVMEKKFINFLDKTGANGQNLILKNLFNVIMYNCDQERDNFEAMKYLIASDIVSNLDKNINITNYFKHVYNSSIHDLIKEKDKDKEKGKILRK